MIIYYPIITGKTLDANYNGYLLKMKMAGLSACGVVIYLAAHLTKADK